MNDSHAVDGPVVPDATNQHEAGRPQKKAGRSSSVPGMSGCPPPGLADHPAHLMLVNSDCIHLKLQQPPREDMQMQVTTPTARLAHPTCSTLPPVSWVVTWWRCSTQPWARRSARRRSGSC